jgi:hypothetical protein
MKNQKKLLQSDYEKIMDLILEKEELNNGIDDELYNKISHQYLKNLKNKYKLANLKALGLLDSAKILEEIISILSKLTGTPKNEMNESSMLNDIRLTAIKRERARQRINTFINGNGSRKYISSVEMNKAEKIKDLVELVKLKLN